MSDAMVEVVELRKSYGSVRAVDGVSFAVRPGELVSLLGPSGCGKTTTLRAIAGFERPDAGDIFVGGQRVTHVPANRRNVGMVFQGYALFPHLSVFDNVAFGLRMRKRPRVEIEPTVARALDLVRLRGFEARLPKELSGGQQQRVAVARALAIQPRVLLLDEPLSNLDAKLRQEMRVELKRILKDTGIATVFVTHDQEEALVLSDRIILMNQGVIEQEGQPHDIYERPRSRFAAAFIGQANFFRGLVVEADLHGGVVVDTDGWRLRGRACFEAAVGAGALVTVRQERVRVLAAGARSECENQRPARLELLNYLGANLQVVCTADGRTITASVSVSDHAESALDPGVAVVLAWRASDALVLADEERAQPCS